MNLKHAALSASRWTASSALIAIGIQLVQTMVLARLLLPRDFGLMAVASSFITVLTLLVDLGLNQALVHYDDVSRKSRSSIYWLNMMLSLVLMLALISSAPLAGDLYDSQLLAHLLCWSSLVFPMAAAGQQMRALAAKALRFDLLAPIDVASLTASLICAISIALLGGGVYALVAALLAQAGVSTLLVWLLLPADYRPAFHFRLHETLPYLSFGSYSVGETMANEVHRNSDIFAGGLVIGAAGMGAFSVPRDLCTRLARVQNSVVTKIGFPVMSHVKGDAGRIRNIYMQTLRMTASINFPLYVALGLFSGEIVNLLYGPKWHDAAVYLQILAAWGLIRSIGNPSGSLLYATGKTKHAFWWNLGLLLVLPPLYWLATRINGLIGLAQGALALQTLIVVPAWWLLIRPCCGATLKEYLLQFCAPLFCALSAGGIAWVIVRNLPHGTVRLAAGFLVGGTSYLALSWLFNKQWMNAMFELLWPARARA